MPPPVPAYQIIYWEPGGISTLEALLNNAIPPTHQIAFVWWSERGCTIVLESRK